MDDAKKGTHRCKGAISDSCIEFLEEGWKEGGVRGGIGVRIIMRGWRGGGGLRRGVRSWGRGVGLSVGES